jgi:hypothetical protein
MSIMQQQQLSDMTTTELKFISKISTMGPDRYFIQFPKEHVKTAKSLKGRYVRVFVKEIAVDENSNQVNK